MTHYSLVAKSPSQTARYLNPNRARTCFRVYTKLIANVTK